MDHTTVLYRMRKFFESGATRTCSFRREQLKKLKNSILQHENELYDAMKADLNKSPEETWITENGMVIAEINAALRGLNAWMEPVEDEIQTSMELDSTEMIKQFVMAGLGISFLAASNCRHEVESGKLATISLAPDQMGRQLGLIYRKDKSLSKAALAFIQVTIDYAGDRYEEVVNVQAATEAVG